MESKYYKGNKAVLVERLEKFLKSEKDCKDDMDEDKECSENNEDLKVYHNNSILTL
jgi:hypothetical protein